MRGDNFVQICVPCPCHGKIKLGIESFYFRNSGFDPSISTVHKPQYLICQLLFAIARCSQCSFVLSFTEFVQKPQPHSPLENEGQALATSIVKHC